jgi:ribosomal protein L11 methyltransferase
VRAGWLLLSVQAPPRGEEPLLVAALRALGAGAVEREGERVVALLPAPADLDALLRRAEAGIRTGTSIREPWLAWRWLSHDEWAARWGAALAPRRVGRFLIVAADDVASPGTTQPPEPGALRIRLRAATAFGTAEHATTRGCLRLLERLVTPGARIVDVGTGSGILAIGAALLGAGRVLALELDPAACAAARENVAANDVGDRVEVRRREARAGRFAAHVAGAGQPGGAGDAGDAGFDGVVANVHAEVVGPLLPELAGALRGGGWLLASGILAPERERLAGAAAAAGFAAAGEEAEEGWWTLWWRRA